MGSCNEIPNYGWITGDPNGTALNLGLLLSLSQAITAGSLSGNRGDPGAGGYYNPGIPQSMLKGIVNQLKSLVIQMYCRPSQDKRLLRSMRNGAVWGATKGAYTGFVGGEILGGEVTFGATGLAGAATGGFVGGTVGAMKGVVWGTASALACRAAGAYNQQQ